MARKFAYACAGVLMLAIAYHLGASTASAQAPGNPVVASLGPQLVITANGDVYAANAYDANGPTVYQFTRAGNVFAGPTNTTPTSWGALKARALR